MRSVPLVSADQVVAVAEAYADRVADAARRLGCPSAAVPEVVRRAGLSLVEACNSEPDRVVDLLGRWVLDVRTLSARARLEAPTTGVGRAGTGPLAMGEEAAQTAAALSGLDERRRLALLMRDSYDAPPAAAAVALELTLRDAQTVVAEARLRLVELLSGEPAPSLRGHESVAGISLASLGALADGSDDLPGLTPDPQVRARRRHVGGCEMCAAVLDTQTRARIALSGLPVLGLSDAERELVLTGIAAQADATLPSDDELIEVVHRPKPVIPWVAVAMSLAIALAIGGGIGAVLRDQHSSTPVATAPTGTVIAPTVTASASVSPSRSASVSVSASPSPTGRPSPSATPSATPSASRSPKPSPSVSRKPTPTAVPTTVPATTAPPVAPTATVTATPTSTASPSVGPAMITATGSGGGNVSVTGTGFTPGGSVTVSSDQPGVNPQTVSADSSGNVTATLTGGSVLNAGTTYDATAVDGSHSATATYTAM